MYLSTATAAFAAGLTLLSSASAVKVLQPTEDSVWSSGTTSQTIAWEAVSTDPDSFQVQIVNQAGFLSNSPVTLINSQSRGSPNVQNSATVTFPNGNWPAGTAFRINLVSTSSDNQAILAQSDEFNITSTGSSGNSNTAASASTTMATSSGTPPQTLAGMQQSTSMTSTVPLSGVGMGASGMSASGNALPNVAATSKGAADSVAAPSALFAGVIGVATFFGVFA